MDKSSEKKQADKLYQVLQDAERPISKGDPADEIETGRHLQKIGQSIHVDKKFTTELNQALRVIAQEQVDQKQKSRWEWLDATGLGRWMVPLKVTAWVAVAVLFFFGLTWIFRNLLPMTPAAVPDVSVTPTNTPDLSEATPQATDPVSIEADETRQAIRDDQPTATPGPVYWQLGFMPDVQVALMALLPEAPGEVQLYSQLSDEPLTVDKAKEIAGKLGLDGTVYYYSSESPQQTNYIVTDGSTWMYFLNSPRRFSYFSGSVKEHEPEATDLTPEEKAQIAENFLKQAGLLDFDYRIEFSETGRGNVLFVPMIDGHPISYSVYDLAEIDVSVDAQGDVTAIYYEKIAYQPVGSYPIRSAQEAWEKLQEMETTIGMENGVRMPWNTNIEWWNRTREVGEKVTLFGYVGAYEPVEPGEGRRITLGEYTLEGAVEGIVEVNQPGIFFQVWGEIVDANRFLVEGWQISPFPDDDLVGIVERVGDKAYLVIENERHWLPELPEEVPQGVEVRVRGIRREDAEPMFDWSSIETGEIGNQGGGGGGGTTFANVTLADPGGSEPLPTVVPVATLAPGTTVEGIEGTLSIMINRYMDGTETKVTGLYLNEQEVFPGTWELRLVGEALDGIEAFNTLPVRVWGVTTGEYQQEAPLVEVSRFEPVYPGLAIQAWIGTWQVANLEGSDVILFAPEDGEPFVLSSSIEWDPDTFVGIEGDRVILEGVMFPDQFFAGYPVVEERSAGPSEDRTDLEGYEITSNQVYVNEDMPELGGKVIIDRVELAYRANDMRFGPYDPNGPPLYIQPVWRFTGYYEDGRKIEIQVQALRDEYLK